MGGFEYDRFKVQVKLGIARLASLQQRHQNGLCGKRKEVADFLRNGQEDRARLAVKYLVRDDYMAEVYEILQMMLDDLLRSAMMIAQEKKCDEQLAPVVKSVIFAAGRVDIPELGRIKEQLIARYGKEWNELSASGADQRLVVKLGIRNPDTTLVNKYLLAIADIYGIAWAPAVVEGDLLRAPSPVPSPVNQAYPVMPVQPLKPDNMSAPPPPYSPTFQTPQQSDSPVYTPTTTDDAPADFDDLARRFEALRKK